MRIMLDKNVVFAAGIACALGTSNAFAANAPFQSFFDQACANASGEMTTRCNHSVTGSNISGDSESSLTPSHMLSAGDTTLLKGKADNLTNGTLTKLGPLSVAFRLTAGELDADDRDDTNAERGYSSDIKGFATTFDYRHSERLISGAILSFERSELTFDTLQPGGAPFTPQARAGRYETDGIGLTAFVNYTATDGLFADAALSYTDLSHDFERNSVYQPSNRSSQLNVSTQADADGHHTNLHLRLGKSFQQGAWSLSPQISLIQSRTTTDSYREKDTINSGLAMRYKRFTQDSLLAVVGAGLQRPFNTRFGVLSAQLRIDYHREMQRDDEEIDAIFINDASGTVFSIEGDDPDKSYFRSGLSLVALLTRGWSVYLDYQHLSANSEYDHNQTALGFRKEF